VVEAEHARVKAPIGAGKKRRERPSPDGMGVSSSASSVYLLPLRRRSLSVSLPFSRSAPTRMALYSCRKLRDELAGMPKSRSSIPFIAVDFPASFSPSSI
jgi:hypothetical protein